MRTKQWLGAIMVMLMTAPLAMGQGQGIPATPNPNPTPGQYQTRTGEERMNGATTMDRTAAATELQSCKASELIGLSVKTLKDEEKGKIKDLVLGRDGRVAYAAVSFGGFLGMGDKLFAVPFEAIHVVKNGNKVEFARVDVTEETIKSRKGFDQEHWPDQADPSFLNGGRNAARMMDAPTAR